MAFRTVFVMKTFGSFGFVSLGIVSNFVLRYSDFSPAKEKDYVGPFYGHSSSHRCYRWSLTQVEFFLGPPLQPVVYLHYGAQEWQFLPVSVQNFR
jgi:hypothetical protein